jgi:hypothetical protein
VPPRGHFPFLGPGDGEGQMSATVVAHLCHDANAREHYRRSGTASEGKEGLQGKDRLALIDEALQALLARHRSAEVDGRYKAYDEHPLEEPEEWGDLASFREAAANS